MCAQALLTAAAEALILAGGGESGRVWLRDAAVARCLLSYP